MGFSFKPEDEKSDCEGTAFLTADHDKFLLGDRPFKGGCWHVEAPWEHRRNRSQSGKVDVFQDEFNQMRFAVWLNRNIFLRGSYNLFHESSHTVRLRD